MRTLSSRVWPALAVAALSAVLAIRVAGASPRDVVLFAAYVVVLLTVPGTLVWRRVAGNPRRFLVNDLVLGTIVGLVLMIPVHLASVAVGAWWLSYAWPLAVLAWALGTRGGRRLWYPGARMPAGWAWGTAVLVAFVVLQLAWAYWSVFPVGNLRGAYVDEPFHIALAGELRHHVPSQMPWVEGVPLFYHWLVYAHVASVANLTGTEPVVLLRLFSGVLFVVLTVLGVLAGVRRLTGRWWAGFLAAALLAISGPSDFIGWTPAIAPFGGARYPLELAYYSPTHGFGTALLVPLLVLLVEAVRHGRLSWQRWVLVGLLMVAVAGAKSSTLPPLLAGLAFVVLAQLVLTRSLRGARVTVPARLLGTGVVVFWAAQVVFYGGGARSLEFAPLDTIRHLVTALGLAPGVDEVSRGVLLGVTAMWLLALALTGIGVLGLIHRGGWREPDHQLLVASYGAAAGATLTFGHPGMSQYYFLNGAAPILVVGSAVGLARLVPGSLSSRRGLALLGAGITGLLVGFTVSTLTTKTRPRPDHDPWAEALRALLLPQLLGLLVLGMTGAAIGFVLWRLWRSRGLAAGAAVAVLVGTLFVRPIAVADAVLDPWPVARPAAPLIGPGGPQAARELRELSEPDDLVATNAHCRAVPRPDCDRRNFWIAGYAERRVLVEGWAYIAPESVGIPSTEENNSSRLPFWDEQRLADNDAVFTDPSPATLGTLREEYGVDWLFVDKRYPHDLRGLAEHAELVHDQRDYAVLRLGSRG